MDSSTALARLLRSGQREITAYYLKIWLEDDLSSLGDCPWEEDLAYARAVCDMLDVPLEVVPLQLEYYERVVQYAIDELSAGRTPSPDIFCNQRIKFGAFYEALESKKSLIASGHYARVEERDGAFHLHRAPDPVKDQSYFLSHLRQDQLSRSLFPIGSLAKTRVRELAREYDLPTKDRPDSQGICFLGKIRYPDFVRHYLGEKPGAIVERETGRVLGEHRGIWFHTIGQRQGLGLGNGPWYVVGKDPDERLVYVSHALNIAEANRSEFSVEAPHWISGPPSKSDLLVKLRHGPDLIPARISWNERVSEGGHGLDVKLDRGDRGLAPGQFCVFYDGTECLGGARIRADHASRTGVAHGEVRHASLSR